MTIQKERAISTEQTTPVANNVEVDAIQVKENVFAQPENYEIIKENGWEHLFDLAQNIADHLDETERLISVFITGKTNKLNASLSKEEQEQWHNEMLVSLTRINQALFNAGNALHEVVNEH